MDNPQEQNRPAEQPENPSAEPKIGEQDASETQNSAQPPPEQQEQQKEQTPPPSPSPTSTSPQKPEVPNIRQTDQQIEDEIQAAIGDMSLMDLYDQDESQRRNASEKAAAKNLNSDGTSRTVHNDGVKRGKVISIAGEDIFVDLGGKTQGILAAEELEESDKIEVGSEIEVSVIRYDKRDGLLILSRKTAAQQILIRNLKEGSVVEARVTGTNKGGLEMDIKGLGAFMPASQIDMFHIEDLKPLIGEKMTCQVIDVKRGDKDIVLSRRNLLEQEKEQLAEQLWAELEKGQTKQGVVRNIMDYGAFVDIGGVDGLLHVREMSWAHVKHPKDILSVGQKIDVVVIDIDREKKRISLSLRQAGSDPWTTAEHKYPIGSKHRAQITNLMDFGAFAELEPGVEGLIPIGEMTWAGRIRHPSDIVQPGMIVEVEVINNDLQKRRIGLSIKSMQENPWKDIGLRYQKQNFYDGTVARITDFGAFVTLEPGVDGLIHISELSHKHVAKVTDVLKQNEQVKVQVLDLDEDNRRISLSLKNAEITETGQAAEQPARQAKQTAPTATDDQKQKKQKPRRGGLSW